MKLNKILKEHLTPMKGAKIKNGGPLGMGRLGFIAPELAQFAYAAVTVLLIFFTWTNLKDPSALLFQRVQFLSGTIALWVVYQIWPCKFMILCRIIYLLLMLDAWYPDTYEINSQFGCLDHLFAGYEQSLFGFQPSLLFSQAFSSKAVSELMHMGYFSYYLFFVFTTLYIYYSHFKQLERVTYMIFGGFFLCYCIYLVLPVVGPQYYYAAVGVDEIAHGNFPDIGHYFRDHMTCLAPAGWRDGIFYHLVQWAHNSGERPTAAFPSSHVAIATLVMMIVGKMRLWRWLTILAIPYIFLCMATVYIYAHYAIDAFAGFLTGIALFFILGGLKLRVKS